MAANRQALATDGPLWVVLGDSMSQGIGATAYDRGWAGQLRDRLAADGHHYRLLNFSVSGARVEDVLTTQLPALEQLGVKPDLVTVLIGANNLLRKKYQAALVPDFTAMLERLPEGSIIGCITGHSALASTANQVLQAAAVRKHFKIADMNWAFRPPYKSKLSEDFFHPNDQGYAGIAAAFEEAITGATRPADA